MNLRGNPEIFFIIAYRVIFTKSVGLDSSTA